MYDKYSVYFMVYMCIIIQNQFSICFLANYPGEPPGAYFVGGTT